MELFVIRRRGVTIGQIGGIYSTLEAALEAAVELKSTEPDDWHTYEVQTYMLNQLVNKRVATDTWTDYGTLIEPTGIVLGSKTTGS